jgi:membrane-bound serine protease (ClpP class)
MMGLVIGLFIAGLVLVFLELIIPSMGLIAASAVALIVWSIIEAFGISDGFGIGMIIASVIGAPAVLISGLKFIPRTKFGQTMVLNTAESAGGPANPDLQELVGQTGTADTILRPAGTALIGHRRVDVVTEGEYLDKDTPVVVVEVQGIRVVVAKRN